jgi:FkbM family methyltransferase
VLADMVRGGRGPQALTFVTRDGQRISCPNRPGARVPVYEVFAEDCYRLDWFLGPLRDEPLGVLDIGAHVGAFACRLAAVAPAAQLLCVEPSVVTAGFLRRNVADNRLENRVQVVEAAVAARGGTVTLADNGGGSALNGLSADGTGTRVVAVPFAELARRLPSVDVVKIDCEGGEYDAVLGSDASAWRSVRRVVLEYHPHDRHGWPDLRDWFASAGLHLLDERRENDRQGTAWLAR